MKKNNLLFVFFSLCIGAVVGGLIWAFLRLLSVGTAIIWEWVPSMLSLPWYPMLICTIGGVVIGLFQRAFGEFPETLQTVMSQVKREGRYPYNHLCVLFVASMLPLLFGASLGPEAGLTGVIVGLCCWAGDRLAATRRNLRELTQIGVTATLGVLFQAPLFGLAEIMEPDTDSDQDTIWPRASKIAAYLTAALGGLAVMWLLKTWFGGGNGLPRMTMASIGWRERSCGIPFALIGVLFGYWFLLCGHAAERVFSILRTPKLSILSTIVGGVFLGICGMLVPLSLFSGEDQIAVLMQSFTDYAAMPCLLLALGALKLLLTQMCLASGWRGGHFFPVIFGGVSIGYGLSLLTGCDPVFCVSMITAGMLGLVMRKPMAVTLLLLICFPANVVLWMTAAAVIGSCMPLPHVWQRMTQGTGR